MMEYAIFRVRDADDYPDPFCRGTFDSKEKADAYMRRHYKESAWKWLEIRERPKPVLPPWRKFQP